MSRFHTLDFGKPCGPLACIIMDIQDILEKTGIRVGTFKFNGVRVYMNTETLAQDLDLVYSAVQKGQSPISISR